MVVPVRYRCPRCDAITTLQRSPSLADKSVTPYPLRGWTYAEVDDEYDTYSGVRIVCGEGDIESQGCGEPYYLNFVRFENGQEVQPRPERERIEFGPDRTAHPPSPNWPCREC